MAQYILLIENNADPPVSSGEWAEFFAAAGSSGVFRGGSAMGDREILGNADAAHSTDFIGGYMIFEAEDKQPIFDLLALHPVLRHGGSAHLCELPVTP